MIEQCIKNQDKPIEEVEFIEDEDGKAPEAGVKLVAAGIFLKNKKNSLLNTQFKPLD